MYYHCRPLKHTEYGKIYPAPIDKLCGFISPAYKWLGNYCGYSPQVWLARSNLSFTGYKNERMIKRRQHVLQKRGEIKENSDSVLFGFETIKGFPVAYESWETMLMFILNYEGRTVEEQNKKISQEFNELLKECKKDGCLDQEIESWEKCGGNLDLFLKKNLFVEVDQVVVPSLNLKAAKQIICRNERQKKTLRQMGFIEDRIIIKNIKPNN